MKKLIYTFLILALALSTSAQRKYAFQKKVSYTLTLDDTVKFTLSNSLTHLTLSTDSIVALKWLKATSTVYPGDVLYITTTNTSGSTITVPLIGGFTPTSFTQATGTTITQAFVTDGATFRKITTPNYSETATTTTFNTDLTYSLAHAIAFYGDTTTGYTPNVVKGRYLKLTPSMTVSEADHITFAGDSATILTGYAGDYEINLYTNLSGTNADKFRLALFKNGANISPFNIASASTTGAGNQVTMNGYWYLTLAVGDKLSFRVTNATNSNDPVFWQIKARIIKMPEH